MQNKKKQSDAEAIELCKKVDQMRTLSDVCSFMSEVVPSGVEKGLDEKEESSAFKDLALVLVRKVRKANWSLIQPSLTLIIWKLLFVVIFSLRI